MHIRVAVLLTWCLAVLTTTATASAAQKLYLKLPLPTVGDVEKTRFPCHKVYSGNYYDPPYHKLTIDGYMTQVNQIVVLAYLPEQPSARDGRALALFVNEKLVSFSIFAHDARNYIGSQLDEKIVSFRVADYFMLPGGGYKLDDSICANNLDSGEVHVDFHMT